MPGAMHTVDVTMVNPGTAVLQCRIADHITAGGWPARRNALPALGAAPAVCISRPGCAAAPFCTNYASFVS